MSQATGGGPCATSVLLCSNDRTLSDLVARNLDRRQYVVRQVPMIQRAGILVPPGMAFDMVVADVDDEDPATWEHVAWLRRAFPYLPLVLLSHSWPSATQAERFRPCHFVRKPFAMDELLAACAAALAVSTS